MAARERAVALKNMVKNSTFGAKPEAKPAAIAEKIPDDMQNLQALSNEQLDQWVAVEARAMDSTANSEGRSIEIKALARTLSAAQLPQLVATAHNFEAPANVRIFSAFLLSQSELPESAAAMAELAKKDMPDLGPVIPHSEAELRHGQELALRYMQVDELFQRAKTSADALDNLRLLARDADSERVRAYAEKKLSELK